MVSSYLLGTLRVSGPAFLTRTAITSPRKDKMSDAVYSLSTDTAGTGLSCSWGLPGLSFASWKKFTVSDGVERQKAKKQL